MTISIYRTSDAWWAGSSDAVAKVDTDATTTAQLLADRPAIDPSGGEHRDGAGRAASSCWRR